MSQTIDLGRLRFYYRGDYNPATTYEMNDVVLYGGSSYIYTYATTSSGNVPTNATYWGKVAEGLDYRGAWASSTAYLPNDIVYYGNAFYIATASHTSSSTFEVDISLSRWTLFSQGFNWRGSWSGNTVYYINDVVSWGGNTYVTITKFTSNSIAFENDTNWSLFAQGSAGGEVATQTSNSGKLLSTNGTVTQWVSNISINDINTNTIDIANIANVGANASSFSANLTNPIAAFQIDALDYAQLAFRNLGTDANSSTDVICYADIGDDDTGWIDMGITSSNFSDPGFTITGVHDGYLFVEAPANSIGGGNLVLATGGNGTDNQIIFAAGGLQSDNTQMAIIPDNRVHIEIATNSTSPTTGALTVVGGIGTQGNVNLLGDLVVQGSITVSGGAFQAETVTSVAPLLSTGAGATGDTIERGFIVEYKRATASSTFLIGSVQASANVLTIRRKSFSTISKQLTSNVATVVLTEAPDVAPGDVVVISNLGAPFDGTFTLSTVSSSTITYPVSGGDVSVTADGDGVVAPNISTTLFLNGDRVTISGSNVAAINGNRDFVISVTGNVMTTDFGTTVISNTAATGTVLVNTRTAYSGFIRGDDTTSNKWYLKGNVPAVLSGSTYVPPSDNIDLTSGTLTNPTLVIGGLEFTGSPTIDGQITFTGNTTFNTGNTTFTNTVALGTSTVTGNPTFNGNPTFSGTPSFTGNPTFTGTPVFTGGVRVQEMIEDIATATVTTANTSLNYNDAGIFYIATPGATNFRINLSNVPTTDNRIFTINVICNQGATGCIPNQLYIDGVAQTVKWASGIAPLPSNSKIDIFNFTITRIGGSYTILASANLGF